MKKITLSPERAKACAAITKELMGMACSSLCETLDREVAHAYDQGAAFVEVPDNFPEEVLSNLDNVSLEQHTKPSIVLIIAFLLKTYTKPSDVEYIVQGVMATLGVDGKMMNVSDIVDDITTKLDI